MIKNDDAATAAVRFQIVHESDGRYHWQLINPHGTPAAQSMDRYATEDEAVAGAEAARQQISQAPVKRP